MSDRNKGDERADAIMRPYLEHQAGQPHVQAVRAFKQSRFLFYCSLLLAAIFAYLAISDAALDRNQSPGLPVLVIIGIAVVLTWQRYRKARLAVATSDHPSAA